jgi:hypothetical protein
MPRLSLGLGVQAVRKVKAGAAPSGIPVASTSIVVITNSSVGSNGTYTKKTPEQALVTNSNGHNSYLKIGVCYLMGGIFTGNLLLSPDAQVWDDEIGAILNTPFGNWKIITAQFDGDLDSWVYAERENNLSTITGYIPNASWSSSITITAA